MNENGKTVTQKFDKALAKFNVINTIFDKFLGFLKKPGDVVLEFVECIASRFSIFAMAACGLLFGVLCLKNMILSLFFENPPIGKCLTLAVVSLIATVVCIYIATKMMSALSKLISSSKCKISSLNIFSVMTFVGLLLSIGSFIGGLVLTWQYREFSAFFAGLAASVFFALITLYCANPEQFGIVEDESASAGEDFVSINTFGLKVMLRLAPVSLLIVPLIGIAYITALLFTFYINRYNGSTYINYAEMMEDMDTAMTFVFTGLIPLVVYFIFLGEYVVLDLIRAVLQLPGKLDSLKK